VGDPAGEEAAAVGGGGEGGTHEREDDLPAVRVAGEGEVDGVPCDGGEQVRVVREEERRDPCGCVPQGGGEVGRAVDEVIDAGEVEVGSERQPMVIEQVNADVGEV